MRLPFRATAPDEEGIPVLDERDIRAMLTLRGSEREGLFAQARAARADLYGDLVAVRAVIEVTNLCRVDCDFCPMRRSNTRANDVFHQTPAEMIETAIGVHALGTCQGRWDQWVLRRLR